MQVAFYACIAKESMQWNVQKQPFSQKSDFIRGKGLCFGCLKLGHVKRIWAKLFVDIVVVDTQQLRTP